jgi:hypothetical protein
VIKKTAAAALAALLVMSALGLTGCGQWFADPVKDANAAIAAANGHLKTFAGSDTTVQKLATDLSAADLSPAGAAKALEVTQKLRTELGKQKAELEAAKKAILSIKALDVKPEFKKYADLEAKAIDTRIVIVGEGVKLYAEMDKMYTAIRDKKTNNTATQKISAEIDTIMNNVAALTEQAKGESQAAADYFKAQKLGGS